MPEATPLVLLHAFPLDAGLWSGVVPALEADRTVVMPEFPGLGGAPARPGASVDGFADDVAALIAGLPGGRAAVGGLSLGGYAALALAARHPERVGALILSNTRAEPDTEQAAAARHASAAAVRAGGYAEFLDGFVPRMVAPGDTAALQATRAMADAQDPEAVAVALEALAGRADRRPDLAAMDMPALVIASSEDVLTPPALSEAMVAAMPDARLHVMDGAGHLSALERPAEWADVVRAFLAGLDG
ncbi:MAG TPA: alpha/beta fold hydrolase [Miltoncostaeaceae bacterium]|nr:alpha/beta fold hydrolase [Miltoncostaeaceae bacterium]